MPRPGPRPYECVRRAWHSDRHQPMRGSLIQEIFRVVNEIHSSATKKNKEWQDKLPIVVLKAEEIMYSKANSEAEYMDLETLWDRANDAINTIIRLDESTETGDFLQPCIEAALNLGCTPMRTSRSQRHNTSTCYLNIKNPDPNLCPPNTLQRTTQETPIAVPPFVSHYSQIMKPPSINLSPFNLKSQIPVLPNDKPLRNKFSFPSPPSAKPPSVYPLYYGSCIEPKDPKILYGAPSECEHKENGEMGFVKKPAFRDPMMSEEHPHGDECDLSLRLGPSTMKSSQQSQRHDVGDIGSSLAKRWNLGHGVGDSGNLLAKRWNLESENMEVEGGRERKRKAVISNLYENLQFCWQPKVSSANSNGGSLTGVGPVFVGHVPLRSSPGSAWSQQEG